MPAKSKNKKRAYKKKGKRGYRKRGYPFVPGLPSNKEFVQFTHRAFFPQITLSSGAGAIAITSRSLTDLSTIDGAGKQPMGFDQALTQYRDYIVKACRCTATFRYPSTTETASTAICGMYFAPSTSDTATSANAQVERGIGSWRFLNSTNEAGTKTIRLTCDLPKLLGYKDIKDSYEDYGGIDGGTPVVNGVVFLWQQPSDATTATNIVASLQMDFLTYWRQPKFMNPS